MEPIDLEPRFSTTEIPGKCIECLAEQELGNCLMELLKGKGRNKKLEQRFEALVSFLRSPESEKLRNESEKYLAEGKEVKVKIYSEEGKDLLLDAPTASTWRIGRVVRAKGASDNIEFITLVPQIETV